MDHLNAPMPYRPFMRHSEPGGSVALVKNAWKSLYPKHGSWMDMAEIEIGIMNRQCIGSYTSSKERSEHKVSCWCQKGNRPEGNGKLAVYD